MVGAINNANLSNLAKVKLVKVLNNLGVVCIVVSTSQIPTKWLALKRSQAPWQTQMWVWSENNGRVKSQGMLLGSQHFGG